MIATALDDLERAAKSPWAWALAAILFGVAAFVFGFDAANFAMNLLQSGLIVAWVIIAKGSHRENRDRLDQILAAAEAARLELIRIREEDQAAQAATLGAGQ